MAWLEAAERRNRHSRTYVDDTTGTHRLAASMAPIHYDNGGSWDAIDLTPQRITNAQLDGWAVTNNGWTYALGQRGGAGSDGWVGFGKRGHAFWFRLARFGYVRTTNLAFQDVGGAPTYARANLSSQAGTRTIGPNADPITPKSLATWNAIWPGVNLRWALRGDQLKEEVILTAAARAALPAPTTPLGQTWFVWAYQVDWSDVPKRIIAGVEVAAGADSGQITGAMELRTALDEAIGFLPLDQAYVVTDPATSLGRTAVNLRKRFYTQGGQPWLVVGLPVSELNGLPAGDIVFDPTINEAVGTSADDGQWVPAVSGFGSTDTGLIVGEPAVTGNNPIHFFMRFQTVAIPAGATINTATMELIKATAFNTNTVNATISANDVDDATAPTTSAQAEALALTTANVAWSAIATGSAGDVFTTPSIVGPLQEVIDRAGWASGNDLLFVVRNNATTSTNAAREFAALDHATYAAPELDVDYTGPTQTIGMSAIASTLTLYNPSVANAGQTITMNAIDSTLTLSNPTVAPGSVTVTTNAIASTLATPNPTVSFPTQTVTPDTVGSTLDLSLPSVTAGESAQTAGPNSGGTFANDSSTGTNAWSNPGNAAASDNSDATVNVSSGVHSQYLKATNFGFAIPTNATILGIVVEAEIAASASASVLDNSVKIVKGGTITGDEKQRGAVGWPTTDTYVEWGGSSDLWGTTWTPNDINSGTFGVVISVRRLNGANPQAQIDHIRITVTYELPATQTVTMNAISSTLALSNPSVTPGSVTVVANAIASTLALYAPTVVPDQFIVAQAISSTLAMHTPSVVYDQTAVMQAIASTLALYDPTVSEAGAITMQTIAATLSLYEPTVTPGSVTVAANAIASSLATYQPVVTPGPVTVATNAISSTLAVYQISDVTQAAVIGMTGIDSTFVVYLLDVEGGVAVAAFMLTARGSLPVYTAIASFPEHTATGSLPVHTAKGRST